MVGCTAPSARSYKRWALYLLLVVLALVILSAIITFWQIAADIRHLRQDYAELQAAATQDIGALGSHLQSMQRDLSLLQRHLRLPLGIVSKFTWLPHIGPTLAAAPQLLRVASGALDTVMALWQMLTVSEGTDLGGGLSLQRFAEWPGTLAGADWAKFDRSAQGFKTDLNALQEIKADELVSPLDDYVTQAQSLSDLVVSALDGIRPLSTWLAFPEERLVLILAQNNDELRATGGFISSIGELRVNAGLPTFGSFVDSYVVENWDKPHSDPPQALRQYMGLDLWVTRDGNWWPDFPTSAQAVADLYDLNQERRVDGVVAVDTIAAEELIEQLTPLHLPDGTRLEPGQVGEAFREGWSLPMEQLVTSGVTITATQAFSDIRVSLTYSRQEGEVWFDSVELCALADPDDNLVRDDSFEAPLGADGELTAWRTKGLSNVDGLVADVAHSGTHSLHLVGHVEDAKVVYQNLGVSGKAGDVFRLSALSRALGAGLSGRQADYALSATFIRSGSPNQTWVSGFPGLSHDWASAGTANVLGAWWRHRKDIVPQATQAAINKLLTQPDRVAWDALLLTVQQLVEERHLQVYVADEGVRQVLAQQHWDGAMISADEDYVLIVDSNVGYNKVTSQVEQSIDYRVDLRTQPAEAFLSIRYANRSVEGPDVCDKYHQYVPSYEAMSQGCFWDYVRVYVPESSQFVTGRGGDEPVVAFQEAGRTVFATAFVLKPGEERTLTFQYTLAGDLLADGRYDVVFQKQAGTRSIPLSLDVLSPRPLSGWSGEGSPGANDMGVGWITDLRVDRRISLQFSP